MPDTAAEKRTHVKKLLLFAIASAMFAQTPPSLTFTGPPNTPLGNTVTVTASVVNTGTTSLAGLQWLFTALPAGVSFGAPTVAAANGTFTPACGSPVLICLIVNETASKTLVDGALMTFPLTIASTATPGPVTINSTGTIFGVMTNGTSVNGITAGAPYVLTILSPCDVNGDGVVNLTDVQAVINGDLSPGTSPCPISATNGGCTLQTVQYVIVASLGGACKVP
jgi:hypothetical protein